MPRLQKKRSKILHISVKVLVLTLVYWFPLARPPWFVGFPATLIIVVVCSYVPLISTSHWLWTPPWYISSSHPMKQLEKICKALRCRELKSDRRPSQSFYKANLCISSILNKKSYMLMFILFILTHSHSFTSGLAFSNQHILRLGNWTLKLA